ncbi:vascular-related unknown protein 4-like [Beta vulgaris subsp. vulgaris]|uniref:vascular-related unknown protein 4-like n=1 Tax=Beta vulgaris subsp. vulgaris TaxID=3555 RepID=UPI0025466B6C|nr:vascular-related unknown protein 4-like [Beta vulgaris subsp. vulgaris]
MEDSMSCTNNKNKSHFSDDGLEFSSEDSSWSSYFDDSVISSNVEDSVICSGPETSSVFSGVVKKINVNDDHISSSRSIAKRRKIREAFIDHDLEDTATSPVCNSEVQHSEQLRIKLQEIAGCDLNMLPSIQQGKHNYGSFFQEKQNTGYIAKDINYKGLREKGLCVVPVSLLFQVR